MAGDDVADAVGVGLLDPHLGVVERLARAVEVDLAALLDGVRAGRLGLAVELPERHAHGEEEAEGVRARAPSRRSPPTAAGRSRDGRAASPNSSQSATRERLPALSAAMPRSDAEIEDLLVDGVGVQHARVHLGRQLLPHPRCQQQMGRPDLAQIVHHRALGLREADPDASRAAAWSPRRPVRRSRAAAAPTRTRRSARADRRADTPSCAPAVAGAAASRAWGARWCRTWCTASRRPRRARRRPSFRTVRRDMVRHARSAARDGAAASSRYLRMPRGSL